MWGLVFIIAAELKLIPSHKLCGFSSLASARLFPAVIRLFVFPVFTLPYLTLPYKQVRPSHTSSPTDYPRAQRQAFFSQHYPNKYQPINMNIKFAGVLTAERGNRREGAGPE